MQQGPGCSHRLCSFGQIGQFLFGTDSQEGETEGEDPWRYLPYMYFWERRSGVTIFSHSDEQRENKHWWKGTWTPASQKKDSRLAGTGHTILSSLLSTRQPLLHYSQGRYTALEIPGYLGTSERRAALSLSPRTLRDSMHMRSRPEERPHHAPPAFHAFPCFFRAFSFLFFQQASMGWSQWTVGMVLCTAR